jgi:hypothetical protein
MGQGKSSFIANQIIDPYEAISNLQYKSLEIEVKRRVLIYDPSGAAPFTHYPPITFDELKKGIKKSGKRYKWVSGVRRVTRLSEELTEEFMEWVVNNFRNGMFVADDASSFLRLSGEPKMWVKEMFRNYRNWSVDPCFVFHRLKDVPRSLRQLISVWVLFRTPDHPDGGVKWFIRNDFPMPSELWVAWQEVEATKHQPTSRIQAHKIVVQTYDSRISDIDYSDAAFTPKIKKRVNKNRKA